jgi:hypothetical protein
MARRGIRWDKRGAALSRMFDYNSAADHILTILVGLLLAMFVVVMFLPG